MKKMIFVLALLTLVGCTSSKVQTIKVPTYYCPAPYIPQTPHLAIDNITEKSSDAQVAIAYAKSVDQLLLHTKKLETELKNYEKMSKTD